jgi:Fe-S oxidoreductase
MLTTAERILFVVLLAGSLALTWRSVDRIRRVLARGPGRLHTDRLARRALGALVAFVGQRTVLSARLGPSLAHLLVAWGFTYYLLVNAGDVLEALVPGVRFMGGGTVGGLYRLGADVLSVLALAGMLALLVRRVASGRRIFAFLPQTPLRPDARRGMARDSAIVAAFILLHVGARFVGASVAVAREGPDPWQPFATVAAGPWRGLPETTLTAAQHAAFWLAIGLILVFLPYVPRSKHLHLIFAPFNFLTRPARRSIGALDPIDFDGAPEARWGAERIEDLPRTQLVDAYACIMCNRCQDVCPAHVTGKALSPSALEINKRYVLEATGARLAAGGASPQTLLEATLSPEALWACTACGACVEICPVGNEPMRDILDVRRHQVLVQGAFPDALQTAYRGLERTGNPWGIGPEQRLAWCAGLGLPTIDEEPDPEILWWVGCAPATEPRAQATARALARILRAAGVRVALLGPRERCTGDPARRSGNEYVFAELARQNVETLQAVRPRRILVTCPHCLHVLGNEYPDFGGRWEVIHHTAFIAELLRDGRLSPSAASLDGVAYHDPCYLGRHNGVYDPPRTALEHAGARLIPLPRSRNRSFCCGAGGAQMWKEEEPGTGSVSRERLREAQTAGATTLAVACPFCMIMLGDAATAAGGGVRVRDVAEIVAAGLPAEDEDERAPQAG